MATSADYDIVPTSPPGSDSSHSNSPTDRTRLMSNGVHERTHTILKSSDGFFLTSRSSTRRSFGREWTRSHWEKVRDLEQESERARRCSKLSSGFAPLMVFGGLVFICIGVSATTNNGKDREKLQQLSAAPMAMGVFMLALGIFLIGSWFGCRGRAKGLEQQLLHGSRRNSLDENVVQSFISKLYSNPGASRRQQASPTLPGVTLDGVDVLKPLSDTEIRGERQKFHDSSAEHPNCCTHCGASNTSTQVILETAI
uniref:uncharacterized protein LOC120347850 n=1 Tax=Styela clava TaxID=7725 RepID=UPI00193A269D|nr:uncharacterized protein LOC120347850 [Styela clava]